MKELSEDPNVPTGRHGRVEQTRNSHPQSGIHDVDCVSLASIVDHMTYAQAGKTTTMAQARVTEFYTTKKRKGDTQPSKRRKLQTSSDVSEAIQDSRLNTRLMQSSKTEKSIPTTVNSELENVLFTFPHSGTGTKSTTAKDSKQRIRKIKQIKGQQTISDVLVARSASPSITESSASEEEVTSAWDEHDGPLTPSKKTKQNNDTNENNKASRKRSRRCEFKDGEKTPQKTRNEETVRAPRSRKKLQLRANVIASSESSENEVKYLELCVWDNI